MRGFAPRRFPLMHTLHSTFRKMALMATLALAPMFNTSSATAGEPAAPVTLEPAQAKGGAMVQTDQGKPAVLFPAAAPIKDKITWTLEKPLEPGFHRLDLDFFRDPKNGFSPDEALLLEGEGGSVLGNVNLYYIGYGSKTFSRNAGFYSDKPVTALSLLKSGQRNLDTVAVSGIKITPAAPAELVNCQTSYHFAVNGGKVGVPSALIPGIYLVNTRQPVAIHWDVPEGKSFDTPQAAEIRVFLDQPATPSLAESAAVTELSAFRYPPQEDASIAVEGNPELMKTSDLAKVETHRLVLKGARGKDAPKLDLVPGGKTIALVTSWDDGRATDIPVADMLQKHGVKGTFYMNHPSEMVARMGELESRGMEVGSHTWSHPLLANVSPKRCLAETAEMRRFLESKLGHPVISFAYPFDYQPAYDAGGDYVLRSLREAGYWSARSAKTGDNRIDGFAEPLVMRSNFHFKAGPEKMKAKLDELLQKPGSVFYFWGHSYELAGGGDKILEDDLSTVGGRDDVWYATLGQLMTWQFIRDHAKIEPAQGAFTVKLPWVHPYLRQVPVSLAVPEGVKEVTWDGKPVPVVNGHAELAW